MKKTLDLCGICYAEMMGRYSMRRLSSPVNMKVTCAQCGRRRYGATYEAEEKGAVRNADK